MANNKYVDVPSIVQVIGCAFKQPQLLDYTDKYTITEDDFPEDFHKIVFGSIYKLHELGAEKITLNSIADYLSSRPKSEAIFIKQKGEEWLSKAIENAQTSAFDYYYALYVSQIANQQIEDYSSYIPKDIEIKITPPQKKVEKRKLFTFLDEEEIDGK